MIPHPTSGMVCTYAVEDKDTLAELQKLKAGQPFQLGSCKLATVRKDAVHSAVQYLHVLIVSGQHTDAVTRAQRSAQCIVQSHIYVCVFGSRPPAVVSSQHTATCTTQCIVQ
jgi:hypothetical protein